jgi:uncharacterized OB-fold protein
MLEKINRSTASRSVQGSIPMYHRYTLGVAGERFFKALRDQQQILTSRCPQCAKRWLPPKMYCETCFVEMTDWSPVEGPGVVTAFTVLHRTLDEEPLKQPVIAVMVGWDDVEGGLLHRLEGVEPSGVKVDMKVAPEWSDGRTGSLDDIRSFRPA